MASVSFRVRAGRRTEDVTMPRSASVGELAQTLQRDQFAEEARGKQVKLVFGGRVLDPAQSLEEYGIHDGTVVLCMFAAAAPAGAAAGRPVAPPTLPQQPPELGLPGGGGVAAAAAAAGGFARLGRLGLPQEQVDVLRGVYFQQVQELRHDYPRRADESAEDHLARLEDQWMMQQGPVSEFMANLAPFLQQHRQRQQQQQQHQAGPGAGGAAVLAPEGAAQPVGGGPLLNEHAQAAPEVEEEGDGEEGQGDGPRMQGQDMLEEPVRRPNRCRIVADFFVGMVMGYFFTWVAFCFLGGASKSLRLGLAVGLLVRVFSASEDGSSGSSGAGVDPGPLELFRSASPVGWVESLRAPAAGGGVELEVRPNLRGTARD